MKLTNGPTIANRQPTRSPTRATPARRHHAGLFVLHLRPSQFVLSSPFPPSPVPILNSSSSTSSAPSNHLLLPLIAECIYSKSWLPTDTPTSAARASDDAKLIFGTVFSLRNMVRKLGGDDDAFIAFRTGQYKLHYYETPANLRFVMMTDTASMSMRNVLHQIYINLWVEYGEFPPRPRCARACLWARARARERVRVCERRASWD